MMLLLLAIAAVAFSFVFIQASFHVDDLRDHHLVRRQDNEINELIRKLEVTENQWRVASQERLAKERARPPVDHLEEPRIKEMLSTTAPQENGFYERAALLVLGHNRADSVSNCLRECLQLKEAPLLRLVAVSLDTDLKIAEEGTVKIFRHRPKDSSLPSLLKISSHIYAAIDAAFGESGVDFTILIEDDLRPSPDFLRLFELGSAALDDETWCVSAWNDNAGVASASWRPDLFQRTSYFPGLGWMISKSVWTESLRQSWPEAPTTGFDHWIRAGSPVRNLDCVFPEVPRVRHVSTAKSANVRGGQATKLERFAFWKGSDSPLRRAPTRAQYVETLRAILLDNRTNSIVVDFPKDLQRYSSLGLWPTELRGHFNGAVLLRRNPPDAATLLVDESSELLPPDRRRVFDVDYVPSDDKATSCDIVCRAKNLRCDQRTLKLADNCDALRHHFPCQKGCGHQLGTDLPAYVDDPRQPTHQQCLVSNKASLRPTCAASHRSTKRLCVCSRPAAS